MNTKAKPLAHTLLSLSLSALFALGSDAAARNIFQEFTKAPTFTPPVGCVPRMQTYGVLSECVKTIEPGHNLVVLMDTAIGIFAADAAGNSELFVDDHVAEIRAYWEKNYPQNNLAFSFRASNAAPGNAPRHGTTCREYSIAVALDKAVSGQSVSVTLRTEGLTCAWRVEGAAAGKHNVEIFWLEAYDEYAPSLGQKPMESFDLIVRDLFASARL